MWGEFSTALLVGLALVFYAIAGYHTILIFLGLRMTRGGPKPFDKGSLRNPVDLPSVSIVIPARDEEIVIEGAVRCADRLQYPRTSSKCSWSRTDPSMRHRRSASVSPPPSRTSNAFPAACRRGS